jgi:excisionase family DNA binding protein
MGMGAGMAGMISQAMAAGMAGQPGAAAVPDVMTVTEAAAYLKVNEADLQALIDEGQVKAKKIGGDFRISKKTLDDFLNS